VGETALAYKGRLTTGIVFKVLSKVNAAYGTSLSGKELASKISNLASVGIVDVQAFAFFSEVEEGLQREFLAVMGLDPVTVAQVAQAFSTLAGYSLPLAAGVDTDILCSTEQNRIEAKRPF
jgi:hypothetical protein